MSYLSSASSLLTEHAGCVAADLATSKLRALQDCAREQALAFVGIFRSSIAPDGKRRGKRIINMVKDWENSYRTVLTRQQKMVRVHLGRVFDATGHDNCDQTRLRDCAAVPGCMAVMKSECSQRN